VRAAAIALALGVAVPAAAQTSVLVVSGLGGEPRYQAAFRATGFAVVDAAVHRLGVPPARVRYLAEETAGDARVAARSTKENVAAALQTLAGAAKGESLVLIVFIGHGSARGGEAYINLPGPDLSAREFAGLLARLPTQRVVVVNTTSASGDWVLALAGPGRIVVTATRSGVEREETLFGQHFATALATDEADRDKDGRLSVLEAFEYARREVARVYERDQRLRTEHALLDADGDGIGTLEPDVAGGDGALAAVTYLDAGVGLTVGDAASDLAAVRDSLQRAVVALRGQKDRLPAADYERRLETLLLELARVSRELRAREGRQP